MNALAPPSSATTHIQNTAPKPPRQMAVDTPTMLPVPTRDAVDTISAPNEEMLPFSFGFSATTWIDSPNRRNWIRPVRIVKYRPATIRNSGTMYGWYKKPPIALTTLSILSIMICLLCNFSFSRRQSGRARDSIQKICQKCNHDSTM